MLSLIIILNDLITSEKPYFKFLSSLNRKDTTAVFHPYFFIIMLFKK